MVFYNIFVTRIRGSVSRYGSGSRKPESIRIQLEPNPKHYFYKKITFNHLYTNYYFSIVGIDFCYGQYLIKIIVLLCFSA